MKMKKHYINTIGVLLIITASLFSNSLLFAQMPDFQPFTAIPTNGNTWENDYESYQYQNPRIGGTYNLRFRLMKPYNWANRQPTDKFPIIVFFHGSGESGHGDPTLQNNSRQLVHGGQRSRNAVFNVPGNPSYNPNNQSFPGFLLYPQMRRTGPPSSEGYNGCDAAGNWNCPNNNWNIEWREAVHYVIDKLIADYQIDPDRIYVHGLSGGGEATWQFIADYPEYVAAAHPMSAAGGNLHADVQTNKEHYKHIPLRSSQGQLDSNPTPIEGNEQVTAIRNIGGSIRYSYYPNEGHNTWNPEYSKADFYSWLLSKRKNQIHVFYEQPLACPGDPVNVRIGLSKTIYPNGRGPGGNPSSGDFGFGPVGNKQRIINYQWAKDATSNVVASGASLNEIVVHSNPSLATNANCTPGVYYARFQRVDNTWTEWSDPITITATRGPSVTPVITSNGRSTILPSLDGSSEVILSSTTIEAAYQWRRDGSNVSGATEINYPATQAGTYTLRSKDPAGSNVESDGVTPVEFRPPTIGCFSNDSNPILVSTSNGLGVPAPPGNFFASHASNSSIIVSWDDRSDNEVGFELYRSVNSGSGYVLVTIIPATSGANPQTYTDVNLQTNTTYYYRMRAINESGGSAYTPVASASTSIDTTKPTSPILTLGGTLRNQILLQWSGATDNVGVSAYDIYQNGALVGSVNGATQYYVATNVVALSTYNFVVRARDLAGNESAPSNQISATARNNGLLYRYYHHNGLSGTAEIAGNGTLEKIGFVTSFTVSPRTQTDRYAFVYEGFINIPTSGTHRFSTETNEGSRMWVNNQLVVNNDGIHTCTKITSGNINLNAGWYPVRIEYFENGGAECFTIRWIRPGMGEATIPTSAFTESVSNPPSVSNPSNFRVLTNPSITYNSVPLAWNDNSNNETGFEISRSTVNSGIFPVVHVTGANTTTWTDTNVNPSTRYHYRIRAINATNGSSIINLNNSSTNNFVDTPPAPAAPPTPATLTATAISATQIDLQWANVAGETGFELQKSSNGANGFVTLTTTGVNVTTFSDQGATGHTTFYYRVRSLGLGGAASEWSEVASATTPNRAPQITDIVDQTLLQNSPTPQTINVNVTDPDNDPINFVFEGLPPGYSFTSNGFGQGVLSFTNVPGGTYNVTINASDGIDTASDVFVLTVGTNSAPIITNLTVGGVAVAPPITPVQNQSVEAGRTLIMVFTVTDASLATGTPPVLILPPGLNFATPAPTWTVASGTTGTYTLRFSPSVSQTGIYENITVRFRDTQGGVNQQVFTLVVNPVDPFFTIAINFVGDPSITSPNYNEGAYYETLPWNNSGPPPAGTGIVEFLSNLKDDQGATVKNIKVSTNGTGPWSGPPNNTDYNTGVNQFPADPEAVFTSKVRRSYWRTQTGSANGQNRNIRFTNLNPALKYKVTLFGAHLPSASPFSPGLNGPDGQTTIYTVTGSIVQELPALTTLSNTNEVRVSSEISPNANGELIINIKGGSGGAFAYINGLILEGKYTENAPPAPPSQVSLQSPQHNRVIVEWQDNSLNESEFRIYRATSANGTYVMIGSVASNIRTFTDQTTNGRTTYYYKVSANNAFGESAQSNFGVVTTPNGIPTLTNPGTQVVTAGQILQLNIQATDPENDPMEFSVNGLPEFASIVDNGNGTGFIRFTPALSDVGAYQLTLNVVDNFSASAEASFSLVVSDPEATETFYVNFTATSSSNEVAPWNNINAGSSTGALPSAVQLRNTSGTLGGVGGNTSLNRSSGPWVVSSDNVGVNTGSNSGLYPDKVMQSGWISSQSTTDHASGTRTITISGLNTNQRYNISILGSRDEYWFANTVYRITTAGSTAPPSPSMQNQERILNTRKNTDGVVRFVGVQPNGSGNISISVRKDGTIEYSGSDNFIGVPVTITHRDAVINGMVIESFPSGTNTPRRPTNLVATPISKNVIRLTWYDNAINETNYVVERATNPEGPFSPAATLGANTQSWDDTDRPANTAYVYRVRATKTTNPQAQSSYSNTAAASTYGQIIRINVNGNAGNGALQAPLGWFNLNTEPAAMLGETGYTWNNLTDDASVVTDIDLRGYNHTGGGSRHTRGYVGSNPIGYPENVMKTNYLYNANSGTEWMLYNLDPNKAYDLVFFGNEWDDASRAKAGQKIVAEFTVGPDRKSIYNPKNDSERAFFYNVRPESDSTLYFKVAAPLSTAIDFIDGGFFNSVEIRGYTPVEAAFDNIAPSIPLNLVASEVGSVDVRLTWTASTDNVGVGGYEIFRGSELVATVTGITTVVTGLQPSTTYTFSVRARDIKGNLSGFSNAVQVTTLNVGSAIVYYPNPVGAITTLGTWGTEPGGGGTNPASFTANNQHFMLNRNASITENFTVTGSNTKLIVEPGVTLTINSSSIVTGQVDVEANGTLIINTNTAPTLGTLAPTSTVTFNNATSNTIPGASYGNLVLDGTASSKTFSTGTYIVNGNLVVHDGVVLTGAMGNSTQLSINGNLVLQGSVGMPADNQLVTVSFAGGVAQNLSIPAENNFKLHQLRVSNNSAVTVNGGTTSKSISLGTSAGGGLIVEEGASLNIGRNNLVINGTGSINPGNEPGELRISKGDISINSTGAQISNLYFNLAADTVKSFHLNANLSGQVNIRNKMFVYEAVNVTSGRLNSAGNIALVSEATNTAYISKIGISGSIIGSVEFQRYLDPKRVYRYMSAPVFNTKISDWQPYMPIIGPFDGASPSTTGNPSLFYYDEPFGGWIQYPGFGGNNQAAFDMGRGYAIFQFNNTTPGKLRISGPIQQGDFDYLNLAPGSDEESDDGWNLLGNVYASPIQWDNAGWQMNQVNSTVWIRENYAGGGGFKVWNSLSGGDPEDFDGTIAQGQAFWIKSNGPSPAVRITEDAKVNQNSITFFRTADPVNQVMITVNRGQLYDKAFLHFSETSTDAIEGKFDALKRDNDHFNISTRVETVDLAINSMSTEFCERTIPLNIRNTPVGTYTFTLNHMGSFDFEAEMILVDRFAGQELIVQDGSQYTFNITSDPASYGNGRFEIRVIKPAINGDTPFALSSTASCNENAPGITLSNSQKGVRYYVVSGYDTLQTLMGTGGNLAATLSTGKLTDGVYNLHIIALNSGCEPVTLNGVQSIQVIKKPVVTLSDDVLASSKTAGAHQWFKNGELIPNATGTTFIPQQSGNYAVEVTTGSCTLRSDDFAFVITGTETGFDDSSISLYPNPAEDILNIMFQKAPQGVNTIRIAVHNVLGQAVMHKDIAAKKGATPLNVKDLAAGLYTVTLELPRGTIQKRFVKK